MAGVSHRCRYAAEAMRGVEIIAYELIEQWSTATAVYIPLGGDGLLASIWRGCKRLGLGNMISRLIGVQPDGCQTLNRALAGTFDPTDSALTTMISGLQVPALFDLDATTAIMESGGHAVEGDPPTGLGRAVDPRPSRGAVRRTSGCDRTGGGSWRPGTWETIGRRRCDRDLVRDRTQRRRISRRTRRGHRPRHINADDIQSVLAEPGASP